MTPLKQRMVSAEPTHSVRQPQHTTCSSRGYLSGDRTFSFNTDGTTIEITATTKTNTAIALSDVTQSMLSSCVCKGAPQASE